MRARTFWIALPIAVAFALCAGPGLATDDEVPRANPAPAEIAPPVDGDVAPDPECEESRDPGPDGDR